MKVILRIVEALLLIVAAIVVWKFFQTQGLQAFGSYGDRALKFWNDPLFAAGGQALSPSFIFKALLFVTLLTVAARGSRRFLKTRVLSRTSIDPGLQYALEVGTGYLVFVLGLIIGLQSVGMNLSSLAFLTGIVGVGIGFGLQNIVNNFVSGLILLIERPIKVGDRVDVGELTGDVIRIAARSTWVRTNDNVVIIVPNSDFISNKVTNWTANDRKVRVRAPLGVGYSSDPDQVREILLGVARALPAILREPGPDVLFRGFGDSSLDFELRVWTEESLRTPQVLKSDLYFAIFKAFSENHIEIPFPQRDIYVRSLPAELLKGEAG